MGPVLKFQIAVLGIHPQERGRIRGIAAIGDDQRVIDEQKLMGIRALGRPGIQPLAAGGIVENDGAAAIRIDGSEG